MQAFLSILGYQGPNTLCLLILLAFFLVKPANTGAGIQRPTPFFFVAAVLLWQFASHVFNAIIKNTLKLPRPDSDPFIHQKLAKSITWKNYMIIHRNFGMPSGHAQAVVSEFTFLALYFKNRWLTIFAMLQVALTLYQRYATRRHSVLQLLAGSSLGVLVGAGFYKAVMWYSHKRVII